MEKMEKMESKVKNKKLDNKINNTKVEKVDKKTKKKIDKDAIYKLFMEKLATLFELEKEKNEIIKKHNEFFKNDKKLCEYLNNIRFDFGNFGEFFSEKNNNFDNNCKNIDKKSEVNDIKNNNCENIDIEEVYLSMQKSIEKYKKLSDELDEILNYLHSLV